MSWAICGERVCRDGGGGVGVSRNGAFGEA